MRNEQTLSELTLDDTILLELGFAMGQNHAFAVVAGRCSAAQAEGLRRLREEKGYKRCAETWGEFCRTYLKISKSEADRTIKLLEDFGPAYFEVSQLTRVSPETYRAIAPHIENGVLHHNGEAIELNAENSRKIAAAVAEIRNGIPRQSSRSSDLTREIESISRVANVEERIHKLGQYCVTIAAEFEKISHDRRLGITRGFLHRTLSMVRDEMNRVAEESGL